jgi:hypothetical protein
MNLDIILDLVGFWKRSKYDLVVVKFRPCFFECRFFECTFQDSCFVSLQVVELKHSTWWSLFLIHVASLTHLVPQFDWFITFHSSLLIHWYENSLNWLYKTSNKTVFTFLCISGSICIPNKCCWMKHVRFFSLQKGEKRMHQI